MSHLAALQRRLDRLQGILARQAEAHEETIALDCQVPESLHTKIRLNKEESGGGFPQQTDWVSDTSDSHEGAPDCKN